MWCLPIGDTHVGSTRAEFPSSDSRPGSLALAPAPGIAAPKIPITLCPDTLARRVAASHRKDSLWEDFPTELLAALPAARIPDLLTHPSASRDTFTQRLSTLGLPVRRISNSQNRPEPQDPLDASRSFWRDRDPMEVSISIALSTI
jgi:hypothetical protein